jgi:hypothetical protein
MNALPTKARTGVIVVLSLAVLALLVAVLILIGGPPNPAFLTAVRKSQLVAGMRVNLHAAVEAEKSAVLAETDEASQQHADEARRGLTAVDGSVNELESLIAQGGGAEEKDLLRDFIQSWEMFKQIDAELLPLAVLNTNLKAKRLSYGPGADAAERLGAALDSLLEAEGPYDRGCEVARWAFRAAAAAGRLQALQAPHIDESRDERMGEIEAAMETRHRQLVEALTRLDEVVDAGSRPAVAEARAAADELWKVNLEIIPLSRQNTNVRSLALSLGRKWVVTAQCEDLLAALQEVVDRPTFRATR